MSGIRRVKPYFILFILFCMNINNTLYGYVLDVKSIGGINNAFNGMVSKFKVVKFNLFSRSCVQDWRCELC
jgi:hypothetical protein